MPGFFASRKAWIQIAIGVLLAIFVILDTMSDTPLDCSVHVAYGLIAFSAYSQGVHKVLTQ